MHDAAAMLDALQKYAREEGGPLALKMVAAHFDIPGGRAWRDFSVFEIETLHRHTLGGVPLPPREGILRLQARMDELAF